MLIKAPTNLYLSTNIDRMIEKNCQNQNKCIKEMLWLNLSCKQRSMVGFTDDNFLAAKCEAIKVTELQNVVYLSKNLAELL